MKRGFKTRFFFAMDIVTAHTRPATAEEAACVVSMLGAVPARDALAPGEAPLFTWPVQGTVCGLVQFRRRLPRSQTQVEPPGFPPGEGPAQDPCAGADAASVLLPAFDERLFLALADQPVRCLPRGVRFDGREGIGPIVLTGTLAVPVADGKPARSCCCFVAGDCLCYQTACHLSNRKTRLAACREAIEGTDPRKPAPLRGPPWFRAVYGPCVTVPELVQRAVAGDMACVPTALRGLPLA